MATRRSLAPPPLYYPGYGCLSCPYPDCIRPHSWAPRITPEEPLMLDQSGMLALWISIGKMNKAKRKR